MVDPSCSPVVCTSCMVMGVRISREKKKRVHWALLQIAGMHLTMTGRELIAAKMV
ncbi:hypothetical protein BDV28DRAFT_136588, partial [Aspergillus coremiiformis]